MSKLNFYLLIFLILRLYLFIVYMGVGMCTYIVCMYICVCVFISEQICEDEPVQMMLTMNLEP